MRKALRYANLDREIERIQAQRILEIGTCKGERSEQMIRAALRFSPRDKVKYFGFDLFEVPPAEEFSARTPPSPVGAVADRLRPLGVEVKLTSGDSRVTLPCGLRDIDLVFIDGGHSDETVRSDFEHALGMVRRGGSIMLDDYWNYVGGGGCNALVDSLDRERFDVTLLDPVDVFKKPYGELRTQMVRVLTL